MPRIKKVKLTQKDLDKAKDSVTDLAIEDRITRSSKGDTDSIVHIGEVVEKLLVGEAGAILKALTVGRISMELDSAKVSGKTSDFHLGRLSMANDLWNDLEQYVLDKDKVLAPKKDDESPQKFYNYSPD